MRMKNDFHIKGWAPTLVLKQRPGGTRKWPIVDPYHEQTMNNILYNMRYKTELFLVLKPSKN